MGDESVMVKKLTPKSVMKIAAVSFIFALVEIFKSDETNRSKRIFQPLIANGANGHRGVTVLVIVLNSQKMAQTTGLRQGLGSQCKAQHAVGNVRERILKQRNVTGKVT